MSHNICEVSVCLWLPLCLSILQRLAAYAIPWVARLSLFFHDSPGGTVFLTRNWGMSTVLRVPGGETGVGFVCTFLSPSCFSLLLKWLLLYPWSVSPSSCVVAFIQCPSVERWSLVGSVWILMQNTINGWLLFFPVSPLFMDWISFYENGLLQRQVATRPLWHIL